MKAWGLAGSAGMEAQVKALAQALGADVEMKDVWLNVAWLPNAVFAAGLARFVPMLLQGDSLDAPWPDLVISCGRRSAAIAMGLKMRAPSTTRFIHIQDPEVSSKYFDLVIAMQHDRIEGGNVIKTRFALHSVTPALLQAAAQKFAAQFAHFAAPRVAVLLGGSTNKYTFKAEVMQDAIAALKKLPGSLLITPSRRTGEHNVALLKAAFGNDPRVYLYNGESGNPYAGLLALVDVIVVSNDSVNMMTDAAATGKPLYILKLQGHEGTKPARFAEGLIAEGIARPLAGMLEGWSYPVSNEMQTLAVEVKRRLSL